ncbi:hypothetical protein NEMBOFW57_009587 [Staphylotrichum longicolle]|uniref:E3 ubiquitin ligase complex SCF subunit n=1 Tax=Staphylotrichum longicolle TaxID=669026 RepID=A0AAD4EPC5_9PEZI|nr:hypothetical protein NEMBOFW57_009587 [Staphylotrichum longicolle]
MQFLRFHNLLSTGSVFTCERVAAENSAVIRQLLKDFNADEIVENTTIIPISVNVSDDCLARVFEWLMCWRKALKELEDMSGSTDNFPIWDEYFFDDVDSDMLFEILIVANYLEITPLYEQACEMAAGLIRGKSTSEIREILNIEGDYTREQEDLVREQVGDFYDNAAGYSLR